MKDVELNPLNQNQKKLLQFGVVLVAALLILGFFAFTNKKSSLISLKNNTVYMQDSKLYVFDDVYNLQTYPDKVLMHYPYLLVIQAEKPLTTVYNLETKKKEKEIKDILLDYYQGNIVYNRKASYYNQVNLDRYCDSAFIKNTQEVLCIAHDNENSFNNELYWIRTDNPKFWKQLYNSKRILTSVSVINNNTYLGEIDFNTKQNYITINNKSMPVDNVVSTIYQMDNRPYFASFKSNLNNQSENYYIISEDKAIKMPGSKIVFYK